MNTAQIEPHSIENAEEARLAVVEVHTSGSGKENKGRDVWEYSFSTDETYQKRLGTITFQRTKKAEAKKGGKTITAEEKRGKKGSLIRKEASLSQRVKMEEGERSVELSRSRKEKNSITGGKRLVTEEKRVKKTGDIKQKEKKIAVDKTSVFGSTESMRYKKMSERTGDSKLLKEHKKTVKISFTGTKTTSESKHLSKQIGDKTLIATEASSYTKTFMGTETSTHSKSLSKEMGDRMIRDEEEKSFTKSFWRGTETSHSTHHSTTKKTDQGMVTETLSDHASHSSMDGTTVKQTKAVETVKDGKTNIKATSHSLNKNVLMATYSFEKSNMRKHKSGIKTGSMTSVSVSSSLPFIQKMLESRMKQKTGKSIESPAGHEQKSLPAPKKQTESSSSPEK